jgi:histidine ammonia-lyase
LTLEDVVRVSEGAEPVELAASARVRMEGARAVVEEALNSGQSVYGLTTGVAERKRFPIGQDNRRPFNRLPVRSHRVAQGPAARPALGPKGRRGRPLQPTRAGLRGTAAGPTVWVEAVRGKNG